MSEQKNKAEAYADDVCQGIGDRYHPMWAHLVNAYNVGHKHGKEYTLSVVRKAVEEVNEVNRDIPLPKSTLEFTEGTAKYILKRIELKLKLG